MSTGLLEQPATDLRPTLDPGSVAHIVAPRDGKTGHALTMEARIYGSPVTALCGHVFVPHRDATKLPVCQACIDIFENGDDHGHGEGSHERAEQ